MDRIISMLKLQLNNFLHAISFFIKIAFIICSIVLFCIGNAKVGADQFGLVGMIPLAILAIYLTLRYFVFDRDAVIKGFETQKKSKMIAVLFIGLSFFLATLAYGVNRIIDEYNTTTINFNQYILHDVAPIALFLYIVDLVFSKTFYIITYPGVSNCSTFDKKGRYSWKYLLFYSLRTIDIVIFFLFFYLVFFIFKKGIYHTVSGGGVVYIFVIIFAIIPFVLDFIFTRRFAKRFIEVTTLEDKIAEEKRQQAKKEEQERLRKLYAEWKITHDNQKLHTGCRYTCVGFIVGLVEDIDQLCDDKYFKSEFPEYADLNLGNVLSMSGYNSLFGRAGDINNHKWNLKYDVEQLKNGEYQINIQLKLYNEKELTKKFSNMSTYSSNAVNIQLEASKAARKAYKKAPSDLKKDVVYDDGSFFGEKVDAAISYQDFEDAEMALRKKEIEREKAKEENSKYLKLLDALNNYFAHLCEFMDHEFNRVTILKTDSDKVKEVKRLKLTLGDRYYMNNRQNKTEKIFEK